MSPEANVQPPRPARLEAYIPRSAELSRLFASCASAGNSPMPMLEEVVDEEMEVVWP